MPPNHFQLSWDSYNSNISNGFSQLQQSEEFVDMTLAAEGHLVKVHRNLIALASPYLKEMLKTAPCQHPVIFLHNVSHKVLSLILEYIYMGEVRIPNDMIDPFIKACKALYINGVADIIPQNIPKMEVEETLPEACPNIQATSAAEVTQPTVKKANFAAHITIDSENYNLEVQNLENDLNQDKHIITSEDVHKKTQLEIPMIDTNRDFQYEIRSLYKKESNDNNIGKLTLTSVLTPQYSVSNRGCLQLILNRYIYYRHHVSKGGRKQRWRCINYRKMHCPAFIDSDGEILTSRVGVHRHLFHDNIIMKKMNKGVVFSSITSANNLATNLNEIKINSDDDDIIT